MINLTTIKGGFVMRELEYLFEGEAEILDETQAHVPTDKGVIFFATLQCQLTKKLTKTLTTF
jgi:hypothetical protein